MKKYKIGPYPYTLFAVLRVDKGTGGASLQYIGVPPKEGEYDKCVEIPPGEKFEISISRDFSSRPPKFEIVATKSNHLPVAADPIQGVCIGNCEPFEIPCPAGTIGDCSNPGQLTCSPFSVVGGDDDPKKNDLK